MSHEDECPVLKDQGDCGLDINPNPKPDPSGLVADVLVEMAAEEQELNRRKIRWMVDKLKFFKTRIDTAKAEVKKFEKSYTDMEGKLREVNNGNQSILKDIKLDGQKENAHV